MVYTLSILREWLRPSWWRYVLTGQIEWCGEVSQRRARWGWRQFVCRWRGHPCGPVWFNVNGDPPEPNMHCRNCDDDLG
jgi:hypothetical protein